MELKFHVGDYVEVVYPTFTYRYFDEWIDEKVKTSLANKWARGREPILHEYATVMVADFHTKQIHEDYRNGRTLCYILTNSGVGYLVRDDAIRKVGE